jgi:hypothetical protein
MNDSREIGSPLILIPVLANMWLVGAKQERERVSRTSMSRTKARQMNASLVRGSCPGYFGYPFNKSAVLATLDIRSENCLCQHHTSRIHRLQMQRQSGYNQKW